MPIPANPKIFHITSVGNLVAIIADGMLVSDSIMIARGGPAVRVGMDGIKQARLLCPVTCHTHLMVGSCVPFYFCSRSVMLFLLHKSNHPNLGYRAGQDPIVHLEADLRETVTWADSERRRWAFSLQNARASYAEFRNDLRDLGEINWDAVSANTWSGPSVAPEIKEAKQAEFLVSEIFPWNLVRRIGVKSRATYDEVHKALGKAQHKPKVEIRPDWYY